MNSLLVHSLPIHKISWKSIHNFFSLLLANERTDKQRDKNTWRKLTASLHFAWVVDDSKCILVTRVCVCVTVPCGIPTVLHGTGCNLAELYGVPSGVKLLFKRCRISSLTKEAAGRNEGPTHRKPQPPSLPKKSDMMVWILPLPLKKIFIHNVKYLLFAFNLIIQRDINHCATASLTADCSQCL